jgi:hypothetical protein
MNEGEEKMEGNKENPHFKQKAVSHLNKPQEE